MSLEGKKIVFTGKLSKKRDVMQKEARELGVIVLAYPNPKMDILVCGELASLRKQEKARDFGAEILDEREYRQRLQGKTGIE
jgi:NAD-dependent DNA ligase